MLVVSLRIVMRMSHFIVENLEYLYVIYTFGKLEKNMDMMRKTLVLIVLVCMGLFQLKATVKGELMTLVSEDFSLMAAGSEAEPEAEEISSMDGKFQWNTQMEYNGMAVACIRREAQLLCVRVCLRMIMVKPMRVRATL